MEKILINWMDQFRAFCINKLENSTLYFAQNRMMKIRRKKFFSFFSRRVQNEYLINILIFRDIQQVLTPN
jgi:hypothetical protein